MCELRNYIGVFMKRLLLVLGLLSLNAYGAADWKGTSPDTLFTVGGQAGMAIRGSRVGGVVHGTVGFKVLNRGFVGGDINDQVFFEVQAGPEFIFGGTYFGLSGHLRWVFHRNEDVSLFALGGFQGFMGTGVTQFSPRFGVGALYHLDIVDVRAEISHNWLTAGVQFPF